MILIICIIYMLIPPSRFLMQFPSSCRTEGEDQSMWQKLPSLKITVSEQKLSKCNMVQVTHFGNRKTTEFHTLEFPNCFLGQPNIECVTTVKPRHYCLMAFYSQSSSLQTRGKVQLLA